jgi:acetone carboxylase gamma subunit
MPHKQFICPKCRRRCNQFTVKKIDTAVNREYRCPHCGTLLKVHYHPYSQSRYPYHQNQ